MLLFQNEQSSCSKELLMARMKQALKKNDHIELLPHRNEVQLYSEDEEFFQLLLNVTLNQKRAAENFTYFPDDKKNNKDWVNFLLRQSVEFYQHLTWEFRNDKELLKEVMKISKETEIYYPYASFELRCDKEILFNIHNLGEIFDMIPKSVHEDKEAVLKIVASKGFKASQFYKLPFSIRNDKDVSIAAAKNVHDIYTVLTDKMKQDVDVFFAKFSCSSWNSILIPKNFIQNLTTNKDTLIQLFDSKYYDKNIFDSIPAEFMECKDVLISSVKYYSKIICTKYLTNDLKSDKYFMLKLVRKNPDVLEFCNEEMKKNSEFVMEAIRSTPISQSNPIVFASESLKNDKTFMLEAVKENTSSYIYASYSLKKDYELSWLAIKQNPLMLKVAPKEIRDSYDFVDFAIAKEPKCFEYASERLRNNLFIVKKATKRDPELFRYASKQFDDREVIGDVLRQSCHNILHINPKFKKDKELMTIAVQKLGDLFKYCDDSLKKDKSFVIETLKVSRDVYWHVPNDMKSDRDIVIAALESKCKIEELTLTVRNMIPHENEEFLLKYIKSNPELLQKDKCRWGKKKYVKTKFIIQRALNDKNFILKLMKEFHQAWLYMENENFLLDKEIMWLSLGHFKLIRELPKDTTFRFL